MGIISPFRPAASSGHVSGGPALPQGSGGSLNCSAATPPEPHPFRKGSVTASLLDGGDGGGPAPLSPEQVEAYLHDKARRTELAGYLADEMCALLDGEIYRPMTSNRRSTFLAHMEALAANLAQAYRLPDDRRDEEDHTDSEFIAALVDAARFFGAERQPGRLS